VGFFALIVYAKDNVLCVQNLCSVMQSSVLLFLVFITFPWVMERIDIGGGIAVLVITAGTALLLIDSAQGWDWHQFIEAGTNGWKNVAVTIGLAIVFPAFVTFVRKSTTHSGTSAYHTLFVHALVGCIISLGVAIPLEIVPQWGELLSLVRSLPLSLIWMFGIIVAILIAIKISIIICARYSDVHVLGIALHLSLLGPQMGLLIQIILDSVRQNNSATAALLTWAKENPTVAAGLVLLTFGVLYWFVRVFTLHFRYNRKIAAVQGQNRGNGALFPLNAMSRGSVIV